MSTNVSLHLSVCYCLKKKKRRGTRYSICNTRKLTHALTCLGEQSIHCFFPTFRVGGQARWLSPQQKHDFQRHEQFRRASNGMGEQQSSGAPSATFRDGRVPMDSKATDESAPTAELVG